MSSAVSVSTVVEDVVKAVDVLTDKVITIGRSYGSGGRTVGKMIADQLGIPYYDSELLEQAAVKSGLSKQFFESHDEKVAPVSMLYGYSGFISNQYGSIEKMANKAQKEIIEEVASKGPCVIVGRRADQILKDRENLFRVFITAPLSARVQHVMDREYLTEKESRDKVVRVDKEREKYYSAFSAASWGSAENYDLCVDTEKIGVERTAVIIAELVKNR